MRICVITVYAGNLECKVEAVTVGWSEEHACYAGE